jgi:WD40 repeat protein/serine/threonine protein kinase
MITQGRVSDSPVPKEAVMAENDICRECGSPLPENAPEGLCPKCLMQVAMGRSQAGVTLDNSPRIDGPGTVIGRYELLELIGEGGMGLVYLAEQKEPVRRRVAFKIIKPGMDSKQVIARFEAEKQALAVLDHPNIARVFDAGCTETGRPYFVMEFVKGLSITRYCDDKKLAIEQRLRLFEQVCEAVHHAHQKGIIHRDLKPSNILVTMQGDRPVPKIIDFGIAKAIASPLTDNTFVTLQGQLLGTPEYMSPEQVDLATQDIDTRSDIYSLGVVLYELLAGVLPFESELFTKAGLAEIQRTIREDEPASPSMRLTQMGDKAKPIAASRGTQVVPLARRLHRELEWIPLKAMRKDRCRRYRSASEMGDDIHNYLAGKPLIAGPETAMYRMQKFVRKHAGSVATAALVVVAIVLGLIVSTAMYFRAEDARQKESTARAEAEQARQAEQEQRRLAENKAEDLRRAMYVNTIQLADATYQNGNARRVRELLKSCPNDLRGWEWDRLNYISDQSIMTLRGHQSWVNSVAVSPDGKRIVSAGASGEIKVWDTLSGTELMTLRGHEAALGPVAFSPDGKRIVSGSRDKTIKVWDTATGTELMTLRGHKSYVYSVVFSPDGERILSASHDGSVRVWDSTTGAELMMLHGHEIAANSAVYSPNGKRIVSAGGWDGKIKVWDAVTGTEMMTLEHGSGVWSLGISPDGVRVVSGGEDGIVKVWDTTDGTEVLALRGHQGEMSSVSFSPDGKRILSASWDNTIRLWDASTGVELMLLRGHEGVVCDAVFTPDGEYVVSGAGDNTIKIWDLSSNSQYTSLKGHKATVWKTALAFSSDGKYILSVDEDGVIKVWDRTTAAETRTLRGFAISPDGTRIVSGSPSGTIKVRNANTSEAIFTLKGRQRPHSTMSFSPDGNRIACHSWDGLITLWDAKTGTDTVDLTARPGSVNVAVFSPDSRYIASEGTDGRITIWDVETGANVRTLGDDDNHVTSLAFDPSGDRIATGRTDDVVKVWDVQTGSQLMSLRVGEFGVISVAFSPDGRRLVASGGLSDNTVRLWDTNTGAEIITLRVRDAPTSSVVFSPDGATLAVAHGSDIALFESAVSSSGHSLRRLGEAARRIVDGAYERDRCYHMVMDQLQADKTMDPAARKLAMQIANSRKWEDAEKLKNETWEAVRLAGKDAETYRSALAKAEKANGWEPNDPGILAGLGAAQYRTGAYEQALKAFARAERLAGEDTDPSAMAFRAMTLHRLGRLDEAKATLDQLRILLQDERFAEDEQAKALLMEAEELIEGGEK